MYSKIKERAFEVRKECDLHLGDNRICANRKTPLKAEI